MGEVRIVSAIEKAKVKCGNELPKPRALIAVQWTGYVWAGAAILRLLWIIVSFMSIIFGFRDWTDAGALAIETVYLGIALSMYLMPFLAMFFGMKRSRYFIPIFCTGGVLVVMDFLPSIISFIGVVPSVAIWACPSIRKWYGSLE